MRAWQWMLRHRGWGPTLRGRLIAGLIALLAIVCVTVGATAYYAVRNSVFAALNAQLQTATLRWNYCIDNENMPGRQVDLVDPDDFAGMSPPDSSVCSGLGPGTFAVRLEDGKVTSAGIVRVWRGGKADTEQVKLSGADLATLVKLPAQAPPPAGTPFSVRTRNLPSVGGTYLLSAFTGHDDDVLITGLPTANMDDTLRSVQMTDLGVSAAVLLLFGVVGTAWVRLSLRPLRRVAATAAQVADLPLESGEVELPAGVPDTDPRTEAGQVGASFNRMLGHIQAALARRAASEARLRRFAADASHELRTPLTAIRGYAELALRHSGPVPDEVAHALRRVQAESARMSVLVDDLLLLARLDAGRPLAAEPVDLSRLAIDATSDARVARGDHRWVLDLPDDPVLVTGDGPRLHQVLANLLSNAGRHTPAGTSVTVRVRAAEPGPDGNPQVKLSVTDDGPGIAPELIPDLFERFTRADTARAHADDNASTGLGLSIVDAVIAAHKGHITVTSHPGNTTFTITLPGIPDPPDPPPAHRPRVRHRPLHR
jgi:two-component system OmpR family sensor kinase